MKPFNLTDFRKGKQVVTRKGKAVTELHYFEHAEKLKLAGTIEGDPDVFTWTESGIYNPIVESGYDLFHPDEEMYVVIYGGNTIVCHQNWSVFKDKESALKESIRYNNVEIYKLVKVD